MVHFLEWNKSLIDQGNVRFDRAKCSLAASFDALGLFPCLMSGLLVERLYACYVIAERCLPVPSFILADFR